MKAHVQYQLPVVLLRHLLAMPLSLGCTRMACQAIYHPGPAVPIQTTRFEKSMSVLQMTLQSILASARHHDPLTLVLIECLPMSHVLQVS